MSELFATDVEFQKLRRRREDADVLRAMLELAADAYPGLDTAVSLAEVDRIAARVHDALETGVHNGTLFAKLSIVSQVLHRDEGFCGDLDHYYDPRNSYLNEVLTRRRGIPITLSIVYQGVANRAGLPVYGIGTPGHFVVGCRMEDETWYVDPFSLGEVLTFDECRRRIEKNLGQSGVLTIEDFHPANPLEVICRVMRNLKTALARENAWSQLYCVQRRLAWLLFDNPDEQRDLGLLCLRVGKGREALELLQRYIDQCDEEHRASLLPYLKAARRMVAEMN